MKKTVVLLILAITFPTITTFAQTKTVVIPLSSSKPAVVAYAGGDQEMNVTSTDTILRTVTLDLSNAGLVIINASGYCDFMYTTDSNSYCRCSITQGNAIDFSNLMIGGGYNRTTTSFMPFGMTRSFPLNAGSQTFNLVCDGIADDSNLRISDTQINAVYYYIPNIALPTPLASLNSSDTTDCQKNFDPTRCN